MMMLAGRSQESGKPITVVDDQFGRLTFTADMAAGIFHLLDSAAAYGTYNLTGSGKIVSWQEIAQEVFELCGVSGNLVQPISTDEYSAGKVVSPRPVHSALKLDKIRETGFEPGNWEDELKSYMKA
jgi:dTDP-4-dehydrorhamnose 3,5-epimerase